MKGLLIKDGYVMWKYSKSMLLMAALFIVVSAFGDNLFFAIFSSLFLTMLPVTVMGLDERSKWDNFAITMPFSRKDMVLSKYVLALLCMLSAIVLNVVVSALSMAVKRAIDWNAILYLTYMMMTVSLLFSTINFPIVFKLGVEKGRMWFILITVIIGALIGGGFAMIDVDSVALTVVGGLSSSVPMFLLPLISLVLFVLSAALSVRLFENREL